jgi:isopenicillin-N epimerase
MHPDWTKMREEFLLAAAETYLNAGTFSALPRPVYEAQTRLMAEAERNPTRIAAWNRGAPQWRAQESVAAYVGAAPEDILFHINVTHALNQALFCLPWPERGEFLVSDLEYGAIVNAAREMARRRGLAVRVFELPRQPASSAALCDAVLAAVGPETVGLLLSHIVSATGMVLPVAEIAPALRRRGVRLIVDGAHGPGLVPLCLGQTEIDAYGGNLHKWFMGPKGTAFLYVARHLHREMRPHLVGWGGADPAPAAGTAGEARGMADPFQRVFQFQGLCDTAPFLALPAVIEFRRRLGEDAIRERIRELVRHARRGLGERLGLELLSPAPELNAGLVACRAPGEPESLAEELFRRHRITVAGWRVNPGMHVLRVSPHIWNSEADIDRLCAALAELRA